MGRISRNNLCPCGSRLKYKKCCFKTDKEKTLIQNLQSKKELNDRITQILGKEVIANLGDKDV